MFSKKSRARKKKFLLETKNCSRTAKIRRKFFGFWSQIFFLRPIFSIFRVNFFARTAIFLMVGFLLFAFFSPFFTLKKISIERNSADLDATEIESALQNFFGENLFFLPHENLRAALFKKFPEFRAVQISENWPDALKLKIEVAPPAANLLNSSDANFSVVSDDGVILSQNPDENLLTIKILQHEKNILPRQKFTEKKILEKIFAAKNLLEKKNLKIAELHFLHAAIELHAIAENGTNFWIDLQQPILPQIEKLDRAAEKIDLQKKFDHIDLRIPKKIFWE